LTYFQGFLSSAIIIFHFYHKIRKIIKTQYHVKVHSINFTNESSNRLSVIYVRQNSYNNHNRKINLSIQKSSQVKLHCFTFSPINFCLCWAANNFKEPWNFFSLPESFMGFMGFQFFRRHRVMLF
jgi:hypothetical protein